MSYSTISNANVAVVRNHPKALKEFVPTKEFVLACNKCARLGLCCGQSTRAAGKGKKSKCERCRVKKIACDRDSEAKIEVKKMVWTNPNDGYTNEVPWYEIPQTALSTPSDHTGEQY